MQRYAIGIEFCGTQYRGWQTQQAGVVSVQETIEKVLSKIADHPVILHAAGRTAHARRAVVGPAKLTGFATGPCALQQRGRGVLRCTGAAVALPSWRLQLH